MYNLPLPILYHITVITTFSGTESVLKVWSIDPKAESLQQTSHLPRQLLPTSMEKFPRTLQSLPH